MPESTRRVFIMAFLRVWFWLDSVAIFKDEQCDEQGIFFPLFVFIRASAIINLCQEVFSLRVLFELPSPKTDINGRAASAVCSQSERSSGAADGHLRPE